MEVKLSEERRKSDKLIWYLMVTSMSILILGGGAWARSINAKVEKIAGMEVNLGYIREDIADIKNIIQRYQGRGF